MRKLLAIGGLVACFSTCILARGRAAETLRVGTPEATAFNISLIDVGVEEGIFAKHGLNVERLDFAGSAKLYPAMAGGAIDITMGSGSDLLFVARGLPMKAVAVWQTAPNDLAILTRADSKITSLAQLRGTRMGVAGPGGLTLWIAMAASKMEGWGPNGMHYLYLGSVSSIIAGLEVGNVDAAVSSTDSVLRLQAGGRGRLLALGGKVTGPFLAHLVFASDALMKSRPAVLRQYLEAWYETVAFAKAHPNVTIRITGKKDSLPPNLGKKLYDIIMPTITDTGWFDNAAFKATADSLVELGQVKTDAMPKESAFYTEAFLSKNGK